MNSSRKAQAEDERSNTGTVAKEVLRSFVERIERLEADKQALQADIKAVFAEAKGNGFDVPTLRTCIKLRKQTPSKREEQQSLLDLYMHALGLGGAIDDAQQSGIDAANAGAAIIDNPFISDDPRFKRWEHGWQAQTGLLAAQDEKQQM
ncbi:GapR family DNA-binding domain-containing protein [Polycladidibacter hongkongensis]|uniref:GapR family DNA-binding domain-containing protein n=1 Tax=Polycladidibacter hongkongensis TaxID=1647556 RepID=UPI0009E8C5F9